MARRCKGQPLLPGGKDVIRHSDPEQGTAWTRGGVGLQGCVLPGTGGVFEEAGNPRAPGWPPTAPCRLGPARWPPCGWASCHQLEQHSHLSKWEVSCSPNRLSMGSLLVLSVGVGGWGISKALSSQKKKSENKSVVSQAWWCMPGTQHSGVR